MAGDELRTPLSPWRLLRAKYGFDSFIGPSLHDAVAAFNASSVKQMVESEFGPMAGISRRHRRVRSAGGEDSRSTPKCAARNREQTSKGKICHLCEMLCRRA